MKTTDRYTRFAYALAVAVIVVMAPAGVRAQSTLTQQEALRLAFPAPLQIERRTAYLSEAQLSGAAQLAGGAVAQGVVTYYAGVDARAGSVAVAYFDVHRVRTLNEVVMVVVAPGGVVRRVEILKFLEPHEYRASRPWLDQFAGKRLNQELSLKRGIANMTGATLTANAVTSAVRRVLALHSVIAPFGAGK